MNPMWKANVPKVQSEHLEAMKAPFPPVCLGKSALPLVGSLCESTHQSTLDWLVVVFTDSAKPLDACLALDSVLPRRLDYYV